jgi:hypothetical protein
VNLSKQQPRDRHLLPPQLMEKVADILKQAVLQQGVDAVKPMAEHIQSQLCKGQDEYYIKQAAVALEPAMRKYYAAVHGCAVAMIQFIFGKCDEADLAILEQLGYHAIQNSGPLSYGFSKHRLKLAAMKASGFVKPGKKPGLNAARRYFQAVLKVVPFKMELHFSKTSINGQCLIDHENTTIYVSADLAIGDKCKTAAMHIFSRVMSWLGDREIEKAQVIEIRDTARVSA